MVISEIMSAQPLCVQADETLSIALATLDEHDFRHLPVMDGERLVGLVSERDLLEAAGWVPGRTGEEDVLADDRPSKVSQVMSRQLDVAGPNVPVFEVVETMASRKVGCMPIIDENGALVGILTERDIAAAYARAVDAGRIERHDDPEVGALMSGVLVCASPDTSLQEACTSCDTAGVRHLPVVKDGELVGIVSDRDLRAAANSGTHDALSVGELMATQVETIDLKSPLSQAARRIADVAISSLPVVDNGRLVGIVTTVDVLSHAAKTLPR